MHSRHPMPISPTSPIPFLHTVHNTVRGFSGDWACNGESGTKTRPPIYQGPRSGFTGGLLRKLDATEGESCDLIKLCCCELIHSLAESEHKVVTGRPLWRKSSRALCPQGLRFQDGVTGSREQRRRCVHELFCEHVSLRFTLIHRISHAHFFLFLSWFYPPFTRQWYIVRTSLHFGKEAFISLCFS